MKLVRAILASSLLLSGGILAHFLSGSKVASFESIFSFFVLSILLASLLVDDKISDVKLFSAVFIAQNGAHFLMGGSTSESISMYFSHTFAGVVTFIAINKGAEILKRIECLLQYLYLHISPIAIFHKSWDSLKSKWAFTPYLSSFKELKQTSGLSLRAPPLQ